MSVYGKMSVSGRPRGGALPEYQGGGVYTPGADMNVRLSDAAGVAAGQAEEERARALAGLGRAADWAVRTGVNAYADYAGAKSAQLMTVYQARVREAMYGEGGILTRKGEAAFDADAALKTRMEEIRRETLGEYGEGDSLVGRFFSLRSREFDAASALAAQRHKSGEYERWWEGEHAALADALAGQAADAWAEPELFGVYLAQTEQATRELLRRKGHGEEAVKKGLRETRSTVFRKAVTRALDMEDIAGAERLLALGRVPSAGGTDAGAVRVPPRMGEEVETLLAEAAEKAGVDASLVRAVAMRESGGRTDAVSPAGARGLMQLMPETARGLGVDPDDPVQNAHGGARYLRAMLDRYGGDRRHALMAYNWGPGNVDAWLRTGRGAKGQAVPKETRDHVRAILGRGSGAGGGESAGPGGPPARSGAFMHLAGEDAAWARGKIDAARVARESRALTEAKRQREAAGLALAQGMVTRLRELPQEEREAETYRMLDEIPDMDIRQKTATLVERELAFQEKRQKAADADAARKLAAGARDMNPIERERYFVQSGASQTVRNLATKTLNTGVQTDVVALSQAKEDISSGMSVEEVSGKYGTLINEKDMESLRALSVDEAAKKANRRQNAVFNLFLATSGLDRKDEDDLAYINEVKVEWEEKMANGEFKTPLEQKDWLYEQLARRINVNRWWPDGTYTPREALEADDAVLPVPAWKVEEIRRQLVRDYGISDPTEEQIQATCNARDAR